MRNHQTTIADIPKNSREVYRVARCTFKGHTGIQIRVWFKRGEEGEYRPSKKGIWLDPDSVVEVAEALMRAVQDDANPSRAPAPLSGLPFDSAASPA